MLCTENTGTIDATQDNKTLICIQYVNKGSDNVETAVNEMPIHLYK